MESEQSRAAAAAIAVLSDEGALVVRLKTYYDPTGNYAGATFDEAREPATRVSPADLLAITTMGVVAGPRAVRRLLSDDGVTTVLDGLADAPLVGADDDLVARGVELHRAIKTALSGGNMWVTASKLAARLRPSLAPVRDRVVVEGLGLANKDVTQDWHSIRYVLQQTEVVERLAEARRAVTAEGTDISHVPDLRLLDAALWMAWSGGAAPDRVVIETGDDTEEDDG